MKFHYAKKTLTLCLVLLSFTSFANPLTTNLTCTPKESKVPLIVKLEKSLTAESNEYVFHYQNNFSGWLFESFLFIGKVNGDYVIVSAGSGLAKKTTSITKAEYDRLRNNVIKSTSHKISSPITENQEFCQYFDIDGKKGVVLDEENSDPMLRKLRKELDALIIYRKE
ncbi:hypothetical protein GBO14_14820 [Pseudoalteromonas shioyasakiensis]|uniref:hypothetical protein n=1 Tax=Pseudoalteromonas shioyasakiensis TaxID=1190813 RepID=UPI0020944183|nr:hypothetical protein [Pseudoalteromonas shioyasakiensis]MCO6355992.1 hypothetical protein [Pseudoalteromonas shioyasakiensis]